MRPRSSGAPSCCPRGESRRLVPVRARGHDGHRPAERNGRHRAGQQRSREQPHSRRLLRGTDVDHPDPAAPGPERARLRRLQQRWTHRAGLPGRPLRDRPGRAAGPAPARRHDGRRHLPDGATVWFEARALDTGEAGLWLVPTCTPGPNAVFPVGTTTATCTATGSRGTTSTGTFDVTVTASNQPPVLQLPAAVTVDAVGPSGAPVSYAATATDDGTATVTCSPASGARSRSGRRR